ncbi:hypothetical protein FUAX_47030 (plasmid) [Fulvitalea axinellae]|uniref:Uncharacterized protein n=1 Tax=Fulvitalea axinellae TaxID=1182444 RepID=A0AAU9CT48_9BACT|nr:hypothetical protein FUAX_47030 [Fulvitalea axinellae]
MRRFAKKERGKKTESGPDGTAAFNDRRPEAQQQQAWQGMMGAPIQAAFRWPWQKKGPKFTKVEVDESYIEALQYYEQHKQVPPGYKLEGGTLVQLGHRLSQNPTPAPERIVPAPGQKAYVDSKGKTSDDYLDDFDDITLPEGSKLSEIITPNQPATVEQPPSPSIHPLGQVHLPGDEEYVAEESPVSGSPQSQYQQEYYPPQPGYPMGYQDPYAQGMPIPAGPYQYPPQMAGPYPPQQVYPPHPQQAPWMQYGTPTPVAGFTPHAPMPIAPPSPKQEERVKEVRKPRTRYEMRNKGEFEPGHPCYVEYLHTITHHKKYEEWLDIAKKRSAPQMHRVREGIEREELYDDIYEEVSSVIVGRAQTAEEIKEKKMMAHVIVYYNYYELKNGDGCKFQLPAKRNLTEAEYQEKIRKEEEEARNIPQGQPIPVSETTQPPYYNPAVPLPAQVVPVPSPPAPVIESSQEVSGVAPTAPPQADVEAGARDNELRSKTQEMTGGLTESQQEERILAQEAEEAKRIREKEAEDLRIATEMSKQDTGGHPVLEESTETPAWVLEESKQDAVARYGQLPFAIQPPATTGHQFEPPNRDLERVQERGPGQYPVILPEGGTTSEDQRNDLNISGVGAPTSQVTTQNLYPALESSGTVPEGSDITDTMSEEQRRQYQQILAQEREQKRREEELAGDSTTIARLTAETARQFEETNNFPPDIWQQALGTGLTGTEAVNYAKMLMQERQQTVTPAPARPRSPTTNPDELATALANSNIGVPEQQMSEEEMMALIAQQQHEAEEQRKKKFALAGTDTDMQRVKHRSEHEAEAANTRGALGGFQPLPEEMEQSDEFVDVLGKCDPTDPRYARELKGLHYVTEGKPDLLAKVGISLDAKPADQNWCAMAFNQVYAFISARAQRYMKEKGVTYKSAFAKYYSEAQKMFEDELDEDQLKLINLETAKIMVAHAACFAAHKALKGQSVEEEGEQVRSKPKKKKIATST